jgi:hypothetical protein
MTTFAYYVVYIQVNLDFLDDEMCSEWVKTLMDMVGELSHGKSLVFYFFHGIYTYPTRTTISIHIVFKSRTWP